MLEVKYVKRIPQYIANSFPIFFKDSRLTNTSTSNDEVLWIGYDMEVSNKPIFCASLHLEGFVIYNGVPYWNIYIDRFEVKKKWRRHGYGRQFVEKLIETYPINILSLCHKSNESDNGASEKFWSEMGFVHPPHTCQYMERICYSGSCKIILKD